MERRLTKSHPDWETLNRAANDLAIAINPQVFFWGFDENGQPTVIDELERIATVEKVKETSHFSTSSDVGTGIAL